RPARRPWPRSRRRFAPGLHAACGARPAPRTRARSGASRRRRPCAPAPLRPGASGGRSRRSRYGPERTRLAGLRSDARAQPGQHVGEHLLALRLVEDLVAEPRVGAEGAPVHAKAAVEGAASLDRTDRIVASVKHQDRHLDLDGPARDARDAAEELDGERARHGAVDERILEVAPHHLGVAREPGRVEAAPRRRAGPAPRRRSSGATAMRAIETPGPTASAAPEVTAAAIAGRRSARK